MFDDFSDGLNMELFFMFWQIVAIFDDFSKFPVHHFEKPSNLAKNEEKPSSTCLQPISPLYCVYPNPGFSDTHSTTNIDVLLLAVMNKN